jgi:hypothetical protein
VRLRLGAALASAITIAAGFVTLVGLLVGDDLGLLSALVNGLGIRVIANFFLQLVTITAAVAILIGVLNLLLVHLERLSGREGGALPRVYSLVLLVSFVAVIATYAFARPTSLILLETVQVSIESALAGLLFFALVYGAATVTRRRASWAGMVFVTTIVIVLLAALPLTASTPLAARGQALVVEVRDWLLAVPADAGARGILLGIALATIVTGVRVLIGQDRSYRE